MKQENRYHDDLNSIEQTAKELFGYDDDALLAELDEAEREWEAEKQSNPELAAETAAEAAIQYEKLMKRVKDEGICGVSEEEYERRRAAEDIENAVAEEYDEEAEPLRDASPEDIHDDFPAQDASEAKEALPTGRHRRSRKRALVLAAVVCVLGVGMTMAVSAKRGYELKLYPLKSTQNIAMRRNTVLKSKASELDEAYSEIETALNIKPIVFLHMPSGMNFIEMMIADKDECAVLKFEYKGNRIYLRQKKFLESKESSEKVSSDRIGGEAVYNQLLNQYIYIEENALQSGEIEYSEEVNVDTNYYYLSGIMDKEEFIKLVEGMGFN